MSKNQITGFCKIIVIFVLESIQLASNIRKIRCYFIESIPNCLILVSLSPRGLRGSASTHRGQSVREKSFSLHVQAENLSPSPYWLAFPCMGQIDRTGYDIYDITVSMPCYRAIIIGCNFRIPLGCPGDFGSPQGFISDWNGTPSAEQLELLRSVYRFEETEQEEFSHREVRELEQHIWSRVHEARGLFWMEIALVRISYQQKLPACDDRLRITAVYVGHQKRCGTKRSNGLFDTTKAAGFGEHVVVCNSERAGQHSPLLRRAVFLSSQQRHQPLSGRGRYFDASK